MPLRSTRSGASRRLELIAPLLPVPKCKIAHIILGLGMADERLATADTTQCMGTELPPAASMLMQSLRSVGYTTATALADVVDNSIAAGARIIRISLAPAPVHTSRLWTMVRAWTNVLLSRL